MSKGLERERSSADLGFKEFVDCTHVICASTLQSDSPAFETARVFLRLSVQRRPFSPSRIRRGSSTERAERTELSESRGALVDGKAVGVGIVVERGWTGPQAALQSSSTPETLRNRV